MNDLTLYKSANGDLSTRLGLRGPYLVVSAVTDITVAEIEQLVEDAETLVEAHKKAVRERDEARAEAKKWKALAEASGRDAVRVAGERDKSLTANRRYREALKRIAAEAAVSRSHIVDGPELDFSDVPIRVVEWDRRRVVPIIQQATEAHIGFGSRVLAEAVFDALTGSDETKEDG